MLTINFCFHAEATKGLFPKGRFFTMVWWSQAYHVGMKMTHSGPIRMQRVWLLKHEIMCLVPLAPLSGRREGLTRARHEERTASSRRGNGEPALASRYTGINKDIKI